jgi:uncharacterized protein YkwD
MGMDIPDRTQRSVAAVAVVTFHRRWVPLLLLVLAAVLCGPVPVRAAAPYAGQERRFLELMNDARTSRGLPELAVSPQVATVARRWSNRMAGDGRLRHNPKVGSQIPIRWTRWGENVGYASNAGDGALANVTRRLHRGFMASDGHRANILGRFNQVGVGVAIDDDGTMWATMVFVQGPRPAAPAGLTDVGGTTHRTAITTAYERGLIDACNTSARRFCPARDASRTTVATTVARMLGLEPSPVSHFTDVAAPSHADALAEAGTVKGCAPHRFCPGRAVTRAQLASLLVRGLPDLEPRTGRRFADVGSDEVHATAVNGLAAAGITKGCTPTRFCPAGKVTRAQLASFVVRALGP